MIPKHLEDLDAEIESMESGLRKPTEEESSTLEQNEEEVVEQDTEDDSNEDDSLDSLPEHQEDSQDSDDQEEDDSTEETKQSPQRRNDWKKRYKSLRSHHDALVYDLRTELSNTKQLLLDLNKKNKGLADQIEAFTSKQDDVFSEEDIDALGEDGIKALRKATQRSVDPLKKQLAEERNARLRQEEVSLRKMQEENKRKFVERFAGIVPDYEAIDRDAKFLKFMQDIDNASGYDRTTLFKRAVQNGDVVRAAGFYQEYLLKQQKPNDALRKKMTPTGNSASTDQARSNKTGKETISMAYINKFYEDVSKGKYRGKASLERDIESKIDKAIIEGRVR